MRILEKDTLRLPGRDESRLSRTERTLLSVLPLQQRMALVFDCWIAGQAIRLYVAHLDVLGYQHKLQQFNRILEDLATRDEADITILAGDLNTFKMGPRPRWTRLRSAAEAAGFEDLTTDIKWTHRSRVPARQKLDAIFVRCDRPLLYESWSLDLPGSDHIPVFAEILGWGKPKKRPAESPTREFHGPGREGKSVLDLPERNAQVGRSPHFRLTRVSFSPPREHPDGTPIPAIRGKGMPEGQLKLVVGAQVVVVVALIVAAAIATIAVAII